MWVSGRRWWTSRLKCDVNKRRGLSVDALRNLIYSYGRHPLQTKRAPRPFMSKHFAIQHREICSYFTDLSGYLTRTAASSASGEILDLADAINQVMTDACAAHEAGNKLIFVGNGGSAAISS